MSRPRRNDRDRAFTVRADQIDIVLRLEWDNAVRRAGECGGREWSDAWRESFRLFAAVGRVFMLEPANADIYALCNWLGDSALAMAMNPPATLYTQTQPLPAHLEAA